MIRRLSLSQRLALVVVGLAPVILLSRAMRRGDSLAT